MKPNRKAIYDMFDGHCAYCGCKLENESGKFMQIDHIEPLRRNWWTKGCLHPENETEVNLFPSCPRCNLYKGSMNIETFRREVKQALKRLEKSASYRNALRFGMIEVKEWDGIFYYEKFNSRKAQK
jgi:5-methylcytosine-specific restriction endonuclease McrA